MKLYEVHAEATRDADRPREQDLHGTFHTFLNTRRPCHYQGPLPTAELPVEDEEEQTAEVVAVQMSEYHTADVRGIDVCALHRAERGGTAVGI